MQPTALVTGAGNGIGRAVALALLGKGYRVALAGRRAESLEQTAQIAGAAASDVLIVPTDVGKTAQVDRLFAAIGDRFGRLDLLFNNAGAAAPPVPIDELSPDQWDAVVAVNLTGSFLCARGAFAMMKAQDPRGGRIINNGSISAQTPRPHSTPYAATKHGVSGLTKSLALDGRAHNIACGQIDIGNAETELSAWMTAGALQANGTRLAEPMMDVRDVAEAVLYMAGLPLDANVLSMTVMATNMPFVGRG
jgi:NAD(P)-dependent dehydrogenase (short-subunit alcohol dehydrogenase family)